MQIIGFTLTKILIERKNDIKGKFKVNSKIDIKEVKEEKVSVVENKDVAKVEFEYSIIYDPNLADISFRGFVLLMGDSKEIKDFISEWKKRKIILSDLKLRIFNTIFHKCNVKAIELEEDFNLPTHIRLPFIRPEQENKNTYTG